MTKDVWKGSRVVRINDNSNSGYGNRGRYYSVLFVNSGETCTTCRAHHKTLTGAIKWAEKILNRY